MGKNPKFVFGSGFLMIEFGSVWVLSTLKN